MVNGSRVSEQMVGRDEIVSAFALVCTRVGGRRTRKPALVHENPFRVSNPR